MDMKSSSWEIKSSKLFAIVCTWSVFFVGLFSVGCWQFGYGNLLSTDWIRWPLPYLSSIALLLMSLAFLNIIYPSHITWYRWLAIALLSIALMRVVEIVFKIDLGLSTILIKTLVKQPSDFPPMLFIGAVNSCLIAILLLCWSKKIRTTKISLLLNGLSFLSVVIAFEGMVIYFLPFYSLYLPSKIPIHFFMAIGQILLGIGLISYNFYMDRIYSIKSSKWRPYIVGGMVFALHCFLIIGIVRSRQISVYESMKSKAQIIEFFISSKVLDFTSHLDHVAYEIELSKRLNKPLSGIYIQKLFLHEKGIRNITYVDPNFLVVQSFSQDIISKQALNFSSEIKKAIEQFTQKQSVFIYIDSINRKLVMCKSIELNRFLHGYVFFDVDLFATLDSSKLNRDLEGYAIRLFYKNLELSAYYDGISKTGKIESYTKNFFIGDIPFRLFVYSTNQLPINKLNYALIVIIGITGIVGSIFTGWILFLLQLSRERLIFAEKTKKQHQVLIGIVKELTFANNLHDALKGMLKIFYEAYGWQVLIYWEWNVQKNILELREYVTYSNGSFPAFKAICLQHTSLELFPFIKPFSEEKTVSLEDFSQENLLRSSTAKQEGLKGYLTLPIYEARQLIGVIEFFQVNRIKIDIQEDWLEFIKNIGNELSIFTTRKEIEEYKAIVKSSSEAIYTLDLNRKRLMNPSF